MLMIFMISSRQIALNFLATLKDDDDTARADLSRKVFSRAVDPAYSNLRGEWLGQRLLAFLPTQLDPGIRRHPIDSILLDGSHILYESCLLVGSTETRG